MNPINFPVLGNSLIMAVVILVHVFLAFVAVAKMDAKTALTSKGCLSCHKYKGEGGTFGPALDEHLRHHSKNELKKFLKTPPPTMPPFVGTDEELDSFLDVIHK